MYVIKLWNKKNIQKQFFVTILAITINIANTGTYQLKKGMELLMKNNLQCAKSEKLCHKIRR